MRADEHPEELLDRARVGGLAPDEQAILQRHLDECSVCALQLSLAPRFEREVAPQPRDPLLYERAVDGAIQRMQRSQRSWRSGRMRRFPRRSRWAAAALLVLSVAAAAAVMRRRMAPRPVIQSPIPAVESPAVVGPIRHVESPPAEAPVMPEASAPKPASPARGAARPTITADALFERAERLRREGHADAAIAIYRRLQATFPETAEAQLSFALAGQLLLDRGHPRDALAQFDRHLGGRGDVGEEALAGRATALEQLHRTPEAVAAWKTLLARYPRSVYAARARARLDQLTEHR
jgi:hypothetical protein